MKYNKLIRDGVPALIKQQGAVPITHRALSDDEYRKKLKEKLREEVDEFLHDEQKVDELVDILEVVYTLGEIQGVNAEALDAQRQVKKAARGGFMGRIVLDEVQ